MAFEAWSAFVICLATIGILAIYEEMDAAEFWRVAAFSEACVAVPLAVGARRVLTPYVLDPALDRHAAALGQLRAHLPQQAAAARTLWAPVRPAAPAAPAAPEAVAVRNDR